MILSLVKHFYLTNIVTSDSSFEHCGNFCFSPLRTLFHGKNVRKIEMFYIYSEKSVIKRPLFKLFFSIIFCIPGTILGTVFKGLSLIDRKVRMLNRNFFIVNDESSKSITFINNNKNAVHLYTATKFKQVPLDLSRIIEKKIPTVHSIEINKATPSEILKVLNLNLNFASFRTLKLYHSFIPKKVSSLIYEHFPQIAPIHRFKCTTKSDPKKPWEKGDCKIILENNQVDDEMIKLLATDCKKISHLTINQCTQLTHQAFEFLETSICETLEELKIYDCPQLPLHMLLEYIKKMPTLSSLEIRGSHPSKNENSLCDKFFLYLSNHKKLKRLSLVNTNFRIYDRHLKLLKNNASIAYLSLEINTQINNSSLLDMLTSLKEIETLILKGSIKINTQFLQELYLHCQALQSLDISECDNIDKQEISSFLETLKSSEKNSGKLHIKY